MPGCVVASDLHSWNETQPLTGGAESEKKDIENEGNPKEPQSRSLVFVWR